jgi:hypothetical protein
MCRKLIFLTSLVLLLGLAGNASAATCWFYGGGSTIGDWDVSGNWWGGVPTSADTANLNEGGVTCVVDSTQTAVCGTIWLPDWQNGTAVCILSMSGGTINVSNNMEMGRWVDTDDDGRLDISGGTITIGGQLHVGAKNAGASAGGTGTVNMTGGTIDVASTLYVPVNTASGTVSLDGGTIEAGGISMDANGLIDIEGGTLIIDGNVVSTIDSYVSSGYITAYSGSGTINRDYNVTHSGQTTVTGSTGAPPLGKATNPNPANSATDVNVTDDLSWTAGTGAASHNVYFGTSSSDVNTATTSSSQFKGNQAGTSYEPGTLDYLSTYYWRIDEVNGPNTTKGDIWSFTTAPAVKFVAAGSVASGTGAITPVLPSGIATNDILLLAIETGNEAISISNQNGGTWTEVTNSPQGTGGTRLTVFWSRYNGTQGNPTTSDSGNHQLGRITAFRGAATSGNPWDVTAGGVESTSDTSGAIPGTTTTVGNTLVVAIIATDLPDATGTANFSSWANGNLTAVTERTDNTTNSGNGGGLGIATGLKATAGAYGNTTVTLANSAVKGMMSIALKPPGGGGGAPTPGQATSPNPADTATNVVISTNLSWTAGPNTSTHNVYLGTAFADVNTATTSSSQFKGNQSSTTYDPPSNLNVSTTYYWRIDEVNDAYSVTTKGSIWSFTTEAAKTPGQATSPSPADTATNVVISTNLSWTAGPNTSTHNVYLGTSSSAVDNATTSSSEFKGNQGSTTYDPPSNLDVSTTYYWRIDEVNDAYSVTTKGSIWSFTTEAAKTPGQATSPSPANSATDVSIATNLSWTAGPNTSTHNVYLGTSSSAVDNATTSSSEFKGNQGSTTYDPPGNLNVSTTYYWRIDEVNDAYSVTTKGSIWSFTTKPPTPGQASSPNPADTATNVVISTNLSWTAGPNTSTHNVYLGTAFADVNTATTSSSQFKGNQGSTTYDPPSNLNVSTTYYWRIDEVNDAYSVTTKGGIWSLTTEAVKTPGQATSPSPANSATNVSVNADLSWTAGPNTSTHNVYFGTSSSAVDNATTSSGEYKGNQGTTTYDPGTMSYLSTYYWRIDEVNDTYSTTTKGSIWSFTTAQETPTPGKATSPSPANSATNVAVSTYLNWTAGPNTSSHNVYLGTSSTDVNTATTSSAQFKGNQALTTYNPPDWLTTSKTYYWRIDEVNDAYSVTTKGDIWSFTTASGTSSGQQVWFYVPSATTGRWDTDADWTPHHPNSLDTANLNKSGKSCIVDSATTAECRMLWLPDWQDGTSACVLSISGGTVIVDTNVEMGRYGGDSTDPCDIGRINISGGTVTVGLNVVVGYHRSDRTTGGEGIINMTGGLIDAAGALQIPMSGSKNGDVNLDGGTIEAGSISMTSNGSLDIEGGTLIIDGNALSTINSYISSGYITAYNGSGTVNRNYNVTNPGQTTVTATPPTQTPGKATSPSPTNSATGVGISTNLSWTAGPNTSSHDVYFGTSSSAVNNATTSSGEFKGNQGSTTYDPPGNLAVSTTYYWRIDEVNDTHSTSTKGDVWSFTTEAVQTPGQATSPNPADTATGVGVNADLSWTAGPNTSTHNVYFGTSSSTVDNATTSSSQFKGNQGGTTYDLGTLNTSTTYYWRIDEVNDTHSTTTKGSVWSFTTGTPPTPGQATSPSPANSATDVSLSTNLSWTAGPNTSSHNVYLGTSSSAVDNATTSSSEFKGNQGSTTYDPPGNLSNDTTYYWRIDEVNDDYSVTTKGSIWNFTTEYIEPPTPGKATSPNPANTATDVSVSTNLSWTAGPNTSSHNVYLGTSFSDVNTATTSSSVFKGNQGSTTYDPASNLAANTTHYWRIDEVNDDFSVTTKGDVWSFTTGAAPTIEVQISCAASGYEVTVSYEVASGLEVRMFNLDVTVDNGAKITGASNFNSKYWVYPGSIIVNQSTEQITNYGSAVCDGNLPGTLDGIGTSGMTIEMASLYVGQANAPANSGTLFKFTVDKACTVDVAENWIRDGVIMKDGSETDPNMSGCTVQ